MEYDARETWRTLAHVQNMIEERLHRPMGQRHRGKMTTKYTYMMMPIISGTQAPWGIFRSAAPQNNPTYDDDK